jgi:hypothetical protein
LGIKFNQNFIVLQINTANSNMGTKSENSEASSEKRSWEPWTPQENRIFFESLIKHGRSWSNIAKDIGTKRQEQVRAYFYRLLKKIKNLLEPIAFTFDNRDRIDCLIVLLSFWETKTHTNFDEISNPLDFANAVKERIIKQRKALDIMRSKRLPTPEKLIVQLTPRTAEFGDVISRAGFNPKLQITLKSKKTIASLIEHLTKKWSRNVEGRLVSVVPAPIRLYPQFKPHHPGWGVEDDRTVLYLYHTLGCPPVCKLEYAWDVESVSSTSRATTVQLPFAPWSPLPNGSVFVPYQQQPQSQSQPQLQQLPELQLQSLEFPLSYFGTFEKVCELATKGSSESSDEYSDEVPKCTTYPQGEELPDHDELKLLAADDAENFNFESQTDSSSSYEVQHHHGPHSAQDSIVENSTDFFASGLTSLMNSSPLSSVSTATMLNKFLTSPPPPKLLTCDSPLPPPLQTKHSLTTPQNVIATPTTNLKTSSSDFDPSYAVSIELSCDGFGTRMLDRKHEETQCREFYKDYEDADETSSSDTASAADTVNGAPNKADSSTCLRKRKHSFSETVFKEDSLDMTAGFADDDDNPNNNANDNDNNNDTNNAKINANNNDNNNIDNNRSDRNHNDNSTNIDLASKDLKSFVSEAEFIPFRGQRDLLVATMTTKNVATSPSPKPNAIISPQPPVPRPEEVIVHTKRRKTDDIP